MEINKEIKSDLRFEQEDDAVWVFSGDSQQGTEISHLITSHIDDYNENDVRLICHYAANEIDRLRAKLAKATPGGFVLVPKELSDEKADDQAMFAWNFNLDLFKSDNRDMTAIQIEEFRLKWCLNKARTLQQDYKAMIEAQEQSHD